MLGNWRKVIVQPDTTIKETLSIIDAEALRIALVVDPNNDLIGTVTDGDVRRGLLRGISLSDSVHKIMNRNPTVASPNLAREELVRIMEEKGILCLPIVDDRSLVGLELFSATKVSRPRLENPIFIMAGGFGTRLKPLTDDCPKPMLKVGEKPLLETILNNFIAEGFCNFYISTHHLPEKIRDYFGAGERWGVSISYIHEVIPLGTGGALSLLPKSISCLPLILINGDILTNISFMSLLNYHHSEKADITMAVREYEHQIPYGVVQGLGHRVIKLSEKPMQKFNVNAGIYAISHEIIRKLSHNTSLDMTDLITKQIADNKKVTMFPVHEYWMDIGKPEDYSRAQKDIKEIEN